MSAAGGFEPVEEDAGTDDGRAGGSCIRPKCAIGRDDNGL
jgi:hypothetical protein